MQKIIKKIKNTEFEGVEYESSSFNKKKDIVTIKYKFTTSHYGPLKSKLSNLIQAKLIEIGLEQYSKMSIDFSGNLREKVNFIFEKKSDN